MDRSQICSHRVYKTVDQCSSILFLAAPTQLIQMDGSSAGLGDELIIWIRCAGAEKHLKLGRTGLKNTAVSHTR